MWGGWKEKRAQLEVRAAKEAVGEKLSPRAALKNRV